MRIVDVIARIGKFLAMFSNFFITNQSKFATLFSKRNLDSIFMLQKKENGNYVNC